MSTLTNLSSNVFSLSSAVDSGIASKVPNLPSPKVTFPTSDDLAKYYAKGGNAEYNLDNIFTNVSQGVPGTPNNLKMTSTEKLTAVAWQSLINGSNMIFLSLSPTEGENWTKPVQLSKVNMTNIGNASNLQIAAAAKTVYLTWQETDKAGLNSVFASTSMDLGKNFKTWQLNPSGTYAWKPEVSIAASYQNHSNDTDCEHNPTNPSCCPRGVSPPCQTGNFAWIQAPVLDSVTCSHNNSTSESSKTTSSHTLAGSVTSKICLGPPVVIEHRSW